MTRVGTGRRVRARRRRGGCRSRTGTDAPCSSWSAVDPTVDASGSSPPCGAITTMRDDPVLLGHLGQPAPARGVRVHDAARTRPRRSAAARPAPGRPSPARRGRRPLGVDGAAVVRPPTGSGRRAPGRGPRASTAPATRRRRGRRRRSRRAARRPRSSWRSDQSLPPDPRPRVPLLRGTTRGRRGRPARPATSSSPRRAASTPSPNRVREPSLRCSLATRRPTVRAEAPTCRPIALSVMSLASIVSKASSCSVSCSPARPGPAGASAGPARRGRGRVLPQLLEGVDEVLDEGRTAHDQRRRSPRGRRPRAGASAAARSTTTKRSGRWATRRRPLAERDGPAHVRRVARDPEGVAGVDGADVTPRPSRSKIASVRELGPTRAHERLPVEGQQLPGGASTAGRGPHGRRPRHSADGGGEAGVATDASGRSAYSCPSSSTAAPAWTSSTTLSWSRPPSTPRGPARRTVSRPRRTARRRSGDVARDVRAPGVDRPVSPARAGRARPRPRRRAGSGRGRVRTRTGRSRCWYTCPAARSRRATRGRCAPPAFGCRMLGSSMFGHSSRPSLPESGGPPGVTAQQVGMHPGAWREGYSQSGVHLRHDVIRTAFSIDPARPDRNSVASRRVRGDGGLDPLPPTSRTSPDRAAPNGDATRPPDRADRGPLHPGCRAVRLAGLDVCGLAGRRLGDLREELVHPQVEADRESPDPVQARREGARLDPADALAVDAAPLGQRLLAQTGAALRSRTSVAEAQAALAHAVGTVGRHQRRLSGVPRQVRTYCGTIIDLPVVRQSVRLFEARRPPRYFRSYPRRIAPNPSPAPRARLRGATAGTASCGDADAAGGDREPAEGPARDRRQRARAHRPRRHRVVRDGLDRVATPAARARSSGRPTPDRSPPSCGCAAARVSRSSSRVGTPGWSAAAYPAAGRCC